MSSYRVCGLSAMVLALAYSPTHSAPSASDVPTRCRQSRSSTRRVDGRSAALTPGFGASRSARWSAPGHAVDLDLRDHEPSPTTAIRRVARTADRGFRRRVAVDARASPFRRPTEGPRPRAGGSRRPTAMRLRRRFRRTDAVRPAVSTTKKQLLPGNFALLEHRVPLSADIGRSTY